MGFLKSTIKSGANNAINQIKNVDMGTKLNSALGSMGLEMPKLDVPDVAKNMKLNIDPSAIKMPAGMDSYISPIASKLMSGVKLPSEIGGVPLPQMPDLSSVSSEVDGYLSGMGLDTNKLGIRSVGEILKTPNLSELKQVQFESPVDMNNLPDLTSSLDDFSLEGTQSEIDKFTNQFPGVDSFDVSKYF
jgi:hypothetical protein